MNIQMQDMDLHLHSSGAGVTSAESFLYIKRRFHDSHDLMSAKVEREV